MNNIQERVEEIIRPYIAQPAVPGFGHFATNDRSTVNTLRDSRTDIKDVMYSIGILHREELSKNPELLDAIIERVEKEMAPSVTKTDAFTK